MRRILFALAAAAALGVIAAYATPSVPSWYWEWAKWRLGHGVYYCQAGVPKLRPAAPERIPPWAWERLRDRQEPRVCVRDAARPVPPNLVELPTVAGDPLEAELEAAVNRTRAEYGLRSLRLDSKLVAAAVDHTRDIREHGYFSHSWSDGRSFAVWSSGYYPCPRAEILAWATPAMTASWAIHLWLESPGHRAALLDDQWREMGVELDGEHATVVFGDGGC